MTWRWTRATTSNTARRNDLSYALLRSDSAVDNDGLLLLGTVCLSVTLNALPSNASTLPTTTATLYITWDLHSPTHSVRPAAGDGLERCSVRDVTYLIRIRKWVYYVSACVRVWLGPGIQTDRATYGPRCHRASPESVVRCRLVVASNIVIYAGD